MNKRSREIVAWSAVLAVTGLAWPAAAQQRAGGNGRALDANTQVGSGGTNAVQGQVDYRARNDVVTGNVSGGRGFQGNVDYSAPGEFRGNLGSNQLFDYRARSLGSSPLISDNARSAALNARAGGQSAVSVYRGFTGVTGYADEFGGGVVALDGGSRGIFSASSLKVGGDISPLLSGSTRAITGDTLGAEVREDGGTTVFSASPLLGIRRTELPALGPYQSDAQIDKRAKQEEDPLDISTQPALDFGLGETSRIEGQRVGQMAGSIVNTPSVIEPGAAPPGLVIGQQLQSLMISDRAGETLDQRVERLESMIFKRTDPAVNRPGSEVYKQLIEQLREESAKPAEQQEPKEDDMLDIGLKEVEEEKLTEAEKIAADALKRAYEVYGRQDEAGEPTDGVDPAQADGEPADSEAVPESIDKLLAQLRTDLPRVGSLAADAEDRANKLMKKAEAALAAGEYFDAEAMYRQAKINAPQNPLATVGLIHAQMGAGLIRSASANLHKLYEQHPELINVRYEADVLPPKDRLQWLQGELQRMIDAGDHGGQPGLLLAYLGHQTQSRQLIRYGIAVAEANAPRDALLGVLRGVWLDDEKAPAAEAE